MVPKVSAKRPSGAADFLLNLTSSRAFVLFLLALALAGTSLAANFWLPWAPGVPVLAYGVILLYSQARLYVRLDESTKDSPYFLGFLLTLAALMRVLFDLAGDSEVDVDAIVSGGSGAILPTLAGLFMRQALWSRDPGEDEREAVFNSLRDQLREHATTFDMAQKRLIALITEFVDAREQMFGREEQAFTRYLRTLETNWTKLDQIAASEATRLEKSRTSLDEAGARLASTHDTVASKLAATGTHIEALNAHLQRLASVAADRTNSVAAAGSALTSALTSLSAAAADLQSFRAGIQAALADVNNFATSLAGIPPSLRSSFEGSASDVLRLHSDLATKIRSISEDVAAIDQVLDQLTALLRDRIANLEVHR